MDVFDQGRISTPSRPCSRPRSQSMSCLFLRYYWSPSRVLLPPGEEITTQRQRWIHLEQSQTGSRGQQQGEQ